jgi:hypothetical protein
MASDGWWCPRCGRRNPDAWLQCSDCSTGRAGQEGRVPQSEGEWHATGNAVGGRGTEDAALGCFSILGGLVVVVGLGWLFIGWLFSREICITTNACYPAQPENIFAPSALGVGHIAAGIATMALGLTLALGVTRRRWGCALGIAVLVVDLVIYQLITS